MRAAVILGALLCLTASACSGNNADSVGVSPEPAAPSASAIGSAASEESGARTTAAPAPSDPALSAEPLEMTSTRIDGRDGRTAWRMDLPEVAGPLGPEVERRVRRSADEGVSRFVIDAPDDVDSSVEVTAKATRNDGRTVQVQLDFFYYAQGAAHPLNGFSTVVLRRTDAAPVLLTDVFTEATPALEAALRYASRIAADEGRGDPAESLSTAVEDWADWHAGPDGMRFLFDDYQAGGYAAGLRELDVPWSIVRLWVRDEAFELLGPT